MQAAKISCIIAPVKDSTLRPGKTPDFVKRLRAEAKKELNAPWPNQEPAGKVNFDKDHDDSNYNDQAGSDFDSDNGVAQYPGQNSEHIGNGTGGVR